MKKKVAIFDVDGTIFRSSLLIRLVEELVKAGVFPKKVKKEYENEYKKWKNREGKYQDYIDGVVHVFQKNLKGVHYSDFSKVAEVVVEEHQKEVYRYTRDLIKDLRKKGYYLLAISQSPKTVLEGFCKRLGFHKVYGRIYETGPQGKFTGVITDLHLIANKANVVRRAAEKENLTLKNSVGVGDTEGDVSFLELVERPICFNPNSKLYKHAKRMKWEVVVERKDVIYKI